MGVRMDRRELAFGAASAAFMGLAASLTTAPPALAAGAWDKVVDLAARCITKGLACEAHCQMAFNKGDKSMAECHAAVRETLVACDATMRLAAYGSKHAKAYAKACAD